MYLAARVPRPLLRDTETICLRCLSRLARLPPFRRRFTTSQEKDDAVRPSIKIQKQWRREYFLANSAPPKALRDILGGPLQDLTSRRKDPSEPVQELDSTRIPPTSTISTPPHHTSEPPHRRRKRLKAATSTNSSSPTVSASPNQQFLPSNSSSTLSTLSASLPTTSFRRLLTTCLSLSKPRLSFLIVLTTTTAYSLYPVPALLLPTTTASPSLSALTLCFLSVGTALCSASANALNMLLEPTYDAQMSRTRNRPIVRGLISRGGALLFATLAGVMGVGGLWYGVNPTVAFLGCLNIVLYAGVYTPLKRISVLNTWAGAVVGGIPPMMGWAAAAGQSASGSGSWRELLFGEESGGGWLLAGLLFCWQFPHFNSLSWPIREEYRNAGYKMLVWKNSAMNGRVALRYAILCFPVCVGLWAMGVTDQGFLVTSSAVNAWMVREAWRFWRLEGHRGSARGLFWASVWHLPGVMVLAMVHKKGLWEGVWRRMNGEVDRGDGAEAFDEPQAYQMVEGQRLPEGEKIA